MNILVKSSGELALQQLTISRPTKQLSDYLTNQPLARDARISSETLYKRKTIAFAQSVTKPMTTLLVLGIRTMLAAMCTRTTPKISKHTNGSETSSGIGSI